MATVRHAASPLDLLSGVAIERERHVRSSDEPGVAAAEPRSTTTRAPSPSAPRAAQGASTSQAVPPSAPNPRSATPAGLPHPHPHLRPRTRLPFPSVSDLPPTTSSLAVHSSGDTYMYGDASGRAVVHRQQLVGPVDGPLASLLATPRTHALSSPFAAPERSRAPSSYGASHAHFPSVGGPRSVAMMRQQPSWPSRLDRPRDRPSAFVPSTILCPPVFPPLSRTSAPGRPRPHVLLHPDSRADLERDEPSPSSEPVRNASVALKASLERPTAVTDKKPPQRAHKKASGDQKGKAKAPPPRPLSRIKLSERPPRDMDRCDAIVSCTLWEDERTVAMQVLVDGHVVARRADTDWVNATKIVNMVPGMTRGKRDTIVKTRFGDSDRIIFRRGALHLKGVWVPLAAAAELAQDYDLIDLLYPLFEDNIRSFLFRPINTERTTLLVVAARERAALCEMPDASSGLSLELREELRIRGEELARFLQYLEQGLGLPGPSAAPSSAPSRHAQLGIDDRRGIKEQARVHVPSAPAPLGARRPVPPVDGVARDECDPPSPPTPPPSGGPLRSTRQQQGLAATYRTRFGFPAEGPSPPEAGPSRSSSTSRVVASSTKRGPATSTMRSIQPDNATPKLKLDMRPYAAPATAVEHPPRPPAGGPAGSAFSWFDNPTPPEHAAGEYFDPSASTSGCPSVAQRSDRSFGNGSDEVEGGSPAEVIVAAEASSPAWCDSGETLEGRSRVEGRQAGRVPASRDVHSRSLSVPTTIGGALDLDSRVLPALTEAPQPAPHEEPANYLALVAELVASLRSPSPKHSPSPLSRLSVTRMSVDAAGAVVHPHVPGFFGAKSHFAPRSVEVEAAAAPRADTEDARGRELLSELLAGRESARRTARDGLGPLFSSPCPDIDASATLDSRRLAATAGLDDVAVEARHAALCEPRTSLSSPPDVARAIPARAAVLSGATAPIPHKRSSSDVDDVDLNVGPDQLRGLERVERACSPKKARLAYRRGDDGSRAAK
ncbi:hypothetical protein JCM3775_007197 [Rhodotorula graminis]